MMYPDMPPLVDQNPPFYPPPQEAADGGQSGFFGAPPGARGNGTPYPSLQQPLSPWLPPTEEPPNSSQSWTYGQYRPGGTPAWPPAQPPAWGQTPVSPWAPTPAGTWGARSSTAPYAAQTPSGYPGFGGYGPRPQPPYFGPNTPTTPNDSNAQPITSGWYGAENAQQNKKNKKRHPSRRQNWGWDGQHWDDVRRSNSMGRVPLQRSASWGYFNTSAYGHEPYSTLNLARRPRDWRPDYTPRDGIAALATYLPRVIRSKSEVQEFSDPIRRQLPPLLLWEPQSRPIYFDLRNDSFLPEHIRFVNLNRPHNDIDLAQLACQPSSSVLHISHPRLPWYIDIQQIHPNGVTVRDVFQQMHDYLHLQIQDKHFFNEELNELDRSHITNAFNSRVGNSPRLHAVGILRVDFLGDECVFEGLVRSSRGVWEMKMTRPQS